MTLLAALVGGAVAAPDLDAVLRREAPDAAYVDYRVPIVADTLSQLLVAADRAPELAVNQAHAAGRLNVYLLDVDGLAGEAGCLSASSPGLCTIRYRCAALPPDVLLCDANALRSLSAFIEGLHDGVYQGADPARAVVEAWRGRPEAEEPYRVSGASRDRGGLARAFAEASGILLAHEVAHLLDPGASPDSPVDRKVDPCAPPSDGVLEAEVEADRRAQALLRAVDFSRYDLAKPDPRAYGGAFFAEWLRATELARLLTDRERRDLEGPLRALYEYSSHPPLARRALVFLSFSPPGATWLHAVADWNLPEVTLRRSMELRRCSGLGGSAAATAKALRAGEGGAALEAWRARLRADLDRLKAEGGSSWPSFGLLSTTEASALDAGALPALREAADELALLRDARVDAGDRASGRLFALHLAALEATIWRFQSAAENAMWSMLWMNQPTRDEAALAAEAARRLAGIDAPSMPSLLPFEREPGDQRGFVGAACRVLANPDADAQIPAWTLLMHAASVATAEDAVCLDAARAQWLALTPPDPLAAISAFEPEDPEDFFRAVDLAWWQLIAQGKPDLAYELSLRASEHWGGAGQPGRAAGLLTSDAGLLALAGYPRHAAKLALLGAAAACGADDGIACLRGMRDARAYDPGVVEVFPAKYAIEVPALAIRMGQVNAEDLERLLTAAEVGGPYAVESGLLACAAAVTDPALIEAPDTAARLAGWVAKAPSRDEHLAWPPVAFAVPGGLPPALTRASTAAAQGRLGLFYRICRTGLDRQEARITLPQVPRRKGVVWSVTQMQLQAWDRGQPTVMSVVICDRGALDALRAQAVRLLRAAGFRVVTPWDEAGSLVVDRPSSKGELSEDPERPNELLTVRLQLQPRAALEGGGTLIDLQWQLAAGPRLNDSEGWLDDLKTAAARRYVVGLQLELELATSRTLKQSCATVSSELHRTPDAAEHDLRDRLTAAQWEQVQGLREER